MAGLTQSTKNRTLGSNHWLGSRSPNCCSTPLGSLRSLFRLALILTFHPLFELIAHSVDRQTTTTSTQREAGHHCLTNSVKSTQTGHSRTRFPSALTQPSHRQRQRQLNPMWVGGFSVHFTHISGTVRSASGSGIGTERAAVSARRKSRLMRC